MFISSAYAQGLTQTSSSSADGLIQMLPIALILLVFYVIVFRPMDQQKKNQDALRATMKKGDEVVTTGGLIGKVQKIDDKEIVLDLADNVRVRVLTSNIAGLYGASLPEPAVKIPGKADKS